MEANANPTELLLNHIFDRLRDRLEQEEAVLYLGRVCTIKGLSDCGEICGRL